MSQDKTNIPLTLNAYITQFRVFVPIQTDRQYKQVNIQYDCQIKLMIIEVPIHAVESLLH